VTDVSAWHYHALVDALNRAQFGVIITAPAARPLLINTYAQQLIDRRDGLTVSEHGLEARRADDTRTLRELIERAARRELAACETLQLARDGTTRPLALHIPVCGYSGAATGHATLFVCDPNYDPVVDRATLSRLFGFTRAEASLALLLMSGRTVEQAAEELFVSLHTIRTHLKRMLLKTDTGRQTELLRLLLTCSAQVRLD
jgi:DNA-binding CsgD family transcriptional regulator